MFVRILKSNQPLVIVLIVIAGVLLWLYSLINPINILIPSDNIAMPFYGVIGNRLDFNSNWSVLLGFIVVLIQAFILVQFNKRHIVINYRTYLPAFFYVLIVSSFVQLQRLNPVLIGALLIFIAVDFLYSTYRTEYALNRIYLAGFFVSIASLFYAPFATCIVLVWISLIILRPFIGREWMVGILGFLTPYLFVFTYYFVFLDDSLDELIDHFIRGFDLIKDFYVLHVSYYLFFGLLLIILLLASYTIAKNFQKKKIKNRKFFEINWWLFFVGLIMFIVYKHVTYEILYLIGIPIAYLLTDYFYSNKRSLYLNIVLILWISSIVYIQIAAR